MLIVSGTPAKEVFENFTASAVIRGRRLLVYFCPATCWKEHSYLNVAQIGIFIIEFFSCDGAFTACYVFTDCVAAAEGCSEQNKQGCNLDNQVHFAWLAM